MNKRFSFGILADILIYALLGAFLALLQTTLMPRLQIYYAVPDLLIGAVCCIGIYKGENTAAAFGLFGGLCVEALGSTGLSLLPLFYTIAGLVCGLIGNNAREKARFAAFLITFPLLCLARVVYSLLLTLVNYWGSIQPKTLFLYTLLPELIYTVAVCIPVFLIVKLFEYPVYAARKKGGIY